MKRRLRPRFENGNGDAEKNTVRRARKKRVKIILLCGARLYLNVVPVLRKVL
jgi:hypothetical protein